MHKLIEAAVFAAIGVLVFASLLIPVVDQATATTDTLENTGYYYMDEITADDTATHTIKWDATAPKILTVDGVDMDITSWGLGAYQQVTVFATETDIIRLGVPNNPDVAGLQWIQIRGGTIGYAQANSIMMASISSGAASISLDSEPTPRALTYTSAFIISSDAGAYVMKKSNESAFLKEDSVIYGMGNTTLNNGENSTVNTVLKVMGTMDDLTITSVVAAVDVSTSDIVIDTTPVNGYIGLYKFDKITFVATVNSADTDCIYSYVIVPASVTAEKAIHADEPTRDILAVLPLILICALIMGVLGYAVYTRIE